MQELTARGFVTLRFGKRLHEVAIELELAVSIPPPTIMEMGPQILEHCNVGVFLKAIC